MLQRLGGSEQLKNAVHLGRRAEPSGFGKQHAAPHFGRLNTGDVQSGPLTRRGFGHTRAVDLNAAHPHPLPRRMKLYFSLCMHRARHQRSGDYGSKPAHREGAVNRQSKVLRRVLFRNRCSQLLNFRAQIGQPCTRGGTDRDHRGIFEKRSPHKFVNFEAHQLDKVIVDHVGFRKDHDAIPNTQEPADVEMFASLWFDGFIGSYNKQNEINATYPG